ncbi:MAG: hypothetical protein WCG27_10435, partial [Pseudomonadota bacterium]
MNKSKISPVILFLFFGAVLIGIYSQFDAVSKGTLLWVGRFIPGPNLVVSGIAPFCEYGIEKIKSASPEQKRKEWVPFFQQLFSADDKVSKQAISDKKYFWFDIIKDGISDSDTVEYIQQIKGPWECIAKALTHLGQEGVPLVNPILTFGESHLQQLQIVSEALSALAVNNPAAQLEILKNLKLEGQGRANQIRWGIFQNADSSVLKAFLDWFEKQPPITFYLNQQEQIRQNQLPYDNLRYGFPNLPLNVIQKSIIVNDALNSLVLVFLTNPKVSADKKMAILQILLSEYSKLSATGLTAFNKAMAALTLDENIGVRFYASAIGYELVFKNSENNQAFFDKLKKDILTADFTKQEDWNNVDLLKTYLEKIATKQKVVALDNAMLVKSASDLSEILAKFLKVFPANSEKLESFIAILMRTPYGPRLDNFWQKYLAGAHRAYAIGALSNARPLSNVIIDEIVKLLKSKNPLEIQEGLKIVDKVYPLFSGANNTAIDDRVLKQLIITLSTFEGDDMAAFRKLAAIRERVLPIAKLLSKKPAKNVLYFSTLILKVDPQKSNYEDLFNLFKKTSTCTKNWVKAWHALVEFQTQTFPQSSFYDPTPYTLFLERCSEKTLDALLVPSLQSYNIKSTLSS